MMNAIKVILMAFFALMVLSTAGMAVGNHAATVTALVCYATMWPLLAACGVVAWYLKERST